MVSDRRAEHTQHCTESQMERTHHHHDWDSAAYVREWIAGDATRDDERRPVLLHVLTLTRPSTEAQARRRDPRP